MAEESEDIEISSGKGGTYKEVIMTQLGRVTKNSNGEFRGGYYTFASTKEGEREIYVPDTRETFNNGVYILTMLLRKRFDKKMNDKLDEFKTNFEKIKKVFMDKSTIEEDIILGESFYENPEDKVALETFKQKKLELHLELFGDMCDLLARRRYLEIGGMVF